MQDPGNNAQMRSPILTPSIIETASATTDPDNSNSGPAAYVLFGVVAVLMLLLVLLVTGIIGSLGTYVSTDIALNNSPIDVESLPDIDELLEEDHLQRFFENESELTA